MALGKTRATALGIPATYWTIGVQHTDHSRKSAWVQLNGYPNEVVRRAQGTTAPIDTVTIQVDYDAVKDGSLASAYRAVKNALHPFEIRSIETTKEQREAGLPDSVEKSFPIFADAEDLL